MTAGIPHTAGAAAFPLGGVGTGTFSLGARGELRDWQLENHPDHGRDNPYSFFALHARAAGLPPVTRVLEARRSGRHDVDGGYPFTALAGLPRLAGATLKGEYPLVTVDFSDDGLPVTVSLTAFTPLVPLDLDASSIPGAVLRYTVANPGEEPVDVTVAGSVSHTAGRGDGPFGMRAAQTVRWREDGGLRGLDFAVDLPPDDPGFGTLALTTAADDVTAKPRWVTGFWPDGAQLFWNDLTDDGRLEPEPVTTLETRPMGLFGEDAGDRAYSPQELEAALPRLRTGSLAVHHAIPPGQSRAFEFFLTWCFPNRQRAWEGNIIRHDQRGDGIVRNHYARRHPSAWDAAVRLHRDLPDLERRTRAFAEALYGGTLDPVLTGRIGAGLATVRSTTCFVLDQPGEGPVLAAWEGSFDHAGSCEGTCTHVWSYAQTVAWLFPKLERSARRVEYLLETDADGAQKFRTNRIFGAPAWFMGPAVDGQLGTLLRLYREWRFCGDDDFLRELWPAADATLRYAAARWDRDGDGLLDGELHNTYDIEFAGIEPRANILYLAALRAATRMARHLGDAPRAGELAGKADEVAGLIESELWNGQYYQQRIADLDTPRYQYGDGLLSDHLLGQYLAWVTGLGDLLDRDRIGTALDAVVRHNFRADLTAHESTQRAYALGGEGGLLLASWPRGGRPRIPFVYADEVWTGIEHVVASSLLCVGRPDEALMIERAVAERYDGVARNPWSEIECGRFYARSLASWALLLAATGADWDAPARTLSFRPAAMGTRLSALFLTSTGWGRVTVTPDALTLHVDAGHLDLDHLHLDGARLAGPVSMTAGERRRFPRP